MIKRYKPFKMNITYTFNDFDLTASEFIGLANQIWKCEYDIEKMADALTKTINITARRDGKLIGIVRILTDGYLFGTIPELLVLPEYQKKGIGRELLNRVKAETPTFLYFGGQNQNKEFFEKCSCKKGMQFYIIEKLSDR